MVQYSSALFSMKQEPKNHYEKEFYFAKIIMWFGVNTEQKWLLFLALKSRGKYYSPQQSNLVCAHLYVGKSITIII